MRWLLDAMQKTCISVKPSVLRLSNDAEYIFLDIQYLSTTYAFDSVIKFRCNRYTIMTKKLTPSHIAVAVAAGLTAQTAFAQTPPVPKTNGTGQEITPMIKLDDNQYSGQGFFEKPAPKKAPVAKVEEKPVRQTTAVDTGPSVTITLVPPASTLPTPSAIVKTPIKDPMLPLNVVGSKDAKENTKSGLTPPPVKKESAPIVSVPTINANLKKPDSLLTPAAVDTKLVAAPKVPAGSIPMVPSTAVVTAPVRLTPAAPAPKATILVEKDEVTIKNPVKKKPPVVKKVVAKKSIVESPFTTMAKEAVPVEVKEVPNAAASVAPVLYAAAPTTPIIITEIVRIDSISLQAPTIAEKETSPLPRLPESEPMVAAIFPAPLPTTPVTPVFTPIAPPVVAIVSVAPAAIYSTPRVAPAHVESATAARVNVPMASATMDDLLALDAPSVNTIRNNSRLQPQPGVAPVAIVDAPVAPYALPTLPLPLPPSKPPRAVPVPSVVIATPIKRASQENRDARIQELLNELKTLKSNPMVVESVQPPVEVIAPTYVAVPKINPAATIQLPLPEAPRALIKPIPKEPARMVTESVPKAPVDVPQTAAIDAPRTMTPAPVLEPRTHRVANPKFVGLPEKGDFIAFMPGSSHVSEETVQSLRSMVDVFKQHGIRKIMLTGTSLRDEDTEGMESSDFAKQRAQNVKSAFQRAGFKGVVTLDDPKRARPGTTPRVGLVALQ